MDEGTRRSPKLKDPGAPGAAKCRGACGIDCPPSCKFVGTYREQYEVGDTGYLIEFPNAILCGTHEGCQKHDACFDVAVAQGEDPLTAPIHTHCNWDALSAYGWDSVRSWMRGGGPYQEWWYFVDNPADRPKRVWYTSATRTERRREVDIRSAARVEVETAHRESIHVWWLVRPRELRAQTRGGFLELVSEFDVQPGAEVAPHSHPTHEWYYVLSGVGTMQIEDAEQAVAPGDLVYIPPGSVHSLRSTDDGAIRCLCFAIAEPDAPEIDYTLN